jgi:hypothetical protein
VDNELVVLKEVCETLRKDLMAVEVHQEHHAHREKSTPFAKRIAKKH